MFEVTFAVRKKPAQKGRSPLIFAGMVISVLYKIHTCSAQQGL
jgi:hypothetical protein